MPVPLLPDYQRGATVGLALAGHAEPLDTAPTYVRTRGATRWHHPRSGHRWPDGRISYTYWCGPVGQYAIGTDDIGPDEPLCATCAGRWIAQGLGTWRFTPMRHLPPSWCPACRSEYWVPEDYRRGTFPCLVCGEQVKGRAISCYFAGCAVTRHRPGPGLVVPCRYHGWHHLVRHEDRAVCRCEVPA